MASRITIDPNEVMSIASNMASLNQDLKEKLESTQKKVNSLADVWTGTAASSTIDSFNSFASKYYETYYDLIDQYVIFLKRNVAEAYPEIDAQIAKLGENVF